MRLSFGLEQRQVQKQVMAPRMIQSMEILQLPLQALEERIAQEISENLVLEIREQDPDLPDEPVERENPDAPTLDEKELIVDEAKNNEEDFERLLNMDQEWPDHFEERSYKSAGRMEEEDNRKHDAMTNAVARPESLQDYLEHQIGEMELKPALHQMAVRIISSLDVNGYLTGNLQDLLQPGASAEELGLAREALTIVRSLDPVGVGSHDLRDCLLLQSTPEMPYYEELKTLISGHLKDMEDNRLPAIERKTGFSIELIQETWKQLRKLNPKPGASFAEVYAPLVTPDVIVEQADDGSYKIRAEEERTPRLRISSYYRQRLLSGEATAEEKKYIRQKLNAAQWLIEAIQQRQNTLTRVSQAIVDHQIRFLEDGPEAIEPLKMQQIADRVGVHVTTVSRAVDDKWIQTPRGIFALRRFFVGGTVSSAGEEITWDSIRVKLQELVDNEDKQHPLRDD